MLIYDDIRNSVVHLIVEWRRDGETEAAIPRKEKKKIG